MVVKNKVDILDRKDATQERIMELAAKGES